MDSVSVYTVYTEVHECENSTCVLIVQNLHVFTWCRAIATFRHLSVGKPEVEWSAMVERLSASDLCSDGGVVRMWVQILAATMVFVSFSKTLYHNCFSPSGPGVNGYLRGQSWLLCLISPMRRNGSNWAVYSPLSWDCFRNDLCAWWAGVIMYSPLI